MRRQLQSDGPWFRLALLGATGWPFYYFFHQIHEVIVSEDHILGKLALIATFACFLYVHYFAGTLQGLGVLLAGISCILMGGARSAYALGLRIRNFGHRLTVVLTDDLVSPRSQDQAETSTTNWPKQLIASAGIVMLLVISALPLLIARDKSAPTISESTERGVVPLPPRIHDFAHRFSAVFELMPPEDRNTGGPDQTVGQVAGPPRPDPRKVKVARPLKLLVPLNISPLAVR